MFGCMIDQLDFSYDLLVVGFLSLQLSVHVDPVPFPPDVIVDVLVGGIATDVLPGGGADNVVVLIYGHVVLSLHGGGAIPCSFASLMSQSLVLRFLSRSVMALLSARSHFGSVDLGLSWHLWLVRFKNWPTGQCSPTPDILIVTFVVSCSTTFITVGLLNTKLAGTYTVIATDSISIAKFINNVCAFKNLSGCFLTLKKRIFRWR